MRREEGHVTVEAAILMPTASIILLLLVYLSSYLYQGCFMTQAAYVAALRGSRHPQGGEAYVQEQLDEWMEGEVLSFGEEIRNISVNGLRVKVCLQRDTPLPSGNGQRLKLSTNWQFPVRNPVAYIRGIRKIREITGEQNE